MFKNKKGDMTLNIIIAAAIAMVVLVVMILIFTGNIGKVNATCDTGDGTHAVVASSECGPWNADYTARIFDPTCVVPGNFKDVSSGQVCCATYAIRPTCYQ